MTKREMFAAAIAIIENHGENVDRVAVLEGLAHEIELLDNRKDKGSKGMTKTQKENEGIKELILATLTEIGEKATVSDLVATDALNGYSNQKISALLRQLVASGQVEKTMEKKKAFFSLVENENTSIEETEENEEE